MLILLKHKPQALYNRICNKLQTTLYKIITQATQRKFDLKRQIYFAEANYDLIKSQNYIIGKLSIYQQFLYLN